MEPKYDDFKSLLACRRETEDERKLKYGEWRSIFGAQVPMILLPCQQMAIRVANCARGKEYVRKLLKYFSSDIDPEEDDLMLFKYFDRYFLTI